MFRWKFAHCLFNFHTTLIHVYDFEYIVLDQKKWHKYMYQIHCTQFKFSSSKIYFLLLFLKKRSIYNQLCWTMVLYIHKTIIVTGNNVLYHSISINWKKICQNSVIRNALYIDGSKNSLKNYRNHLCFFLENTEEGLFLTLKLHLFWHHGKSFGSLIFHTLTLKKSNWNLFFIFFFLLLLIIKWMQN